MITFFQAQRFPSTKALPRVDASLLARVQDHHLSQATLFDTSGVFDRLQTSSSHRAPAANGSPD